MNEVYLLTEDILVGVAKSTRRDKFEIKRGYLRDDKNSAFYSPFNIAWCWATYKES